MKKIILLLFLFTSVITFAQRIDNCNYYKPEFKIYRIKILPLQPNLLQWNYKYNVHIFTGLKIIECPKLYIPKYKLEYPLIKLFNPDTIFKKSTHYVIRNNIYI